MFLLGGQGMFLLMRRGEGGGVGGGRGAGIWGDREAVFVQPLDKISPAEKVSVELGRKRRGSRCWYPKHALCVLTRVVGSPSLVPSGTGCLWSKAQQMVCMKEVFPEGKPGAVRAF